MKKAKAIRKLYAQLVLANGNVSSDNRRLLKAFSSMRREDFVGVGPWYIRAPIGYIETPSNHCEHLYQDVLIALEKESGINNGQPSLHARSINALQIKPGEKIAHIGAGTGYYSAILAYVTGKSGQVMAFEIDADLAQAASSNLSPYSNVTVNAASGINENFPEVDVIYVSAGVTHPASIWLDKLRPGGRLMFPWTGDNHRGGMILLRKISLDYFAFTPICGVNFIPCTGLRDTDIGIRLTQAIEDGQHMRVKSLRRNSSPDETNCFATDNWWLSSEELP